MIGQFKKLVKETGALFGARHYRGYHFLYTLSDHVAHFGLEHHESSDDRTGERTLIEPDMLKASGYLLPHEFVHSWNGKYRRPAGLISGGHDGGYDIPMKGDLLWVYEGLTNYLGEVLAPRSGLWTRGGLSRIAGRYRGGAGQQVRPHLASARRHRDCRAGLVRGRRRLRQPAPQRGLLSRGFADLAGGRHHHPADTARGRNRSTISAGSSTAARAARPRSSPTTSTTWWLRSMRCSPTIGPISSISA